MDEFQVELFIPTLAQLPLGLTGVANLVTAFLQSSEISKTVSFKSIKFRKLISISELNDSYLKSMSQYKFMEVLLLQ